MVDLTVLANEQLPQKVVEFIEKEMKYYHGNLVMKEHFTMPLNSKAYVCHRLYFIIVPEDVGLRLLFSVSWYDNSGRIEELDEKHMSESEIMRFYELLKGSERDEL